MAALDKCRRLFSIGQPKLIFVFVPSRDMQCADNAESRTKLSLHQQEQPPGKISPTLPSLPAQCRKNLTEFSLACRQFILNPLLSSEYLSTYPDQIHGSLRCLRGVGFSRTHHEPRISSRTGCGVARLVGIREYVFQARGLGALPYNVLRVLRSDTG